MKRFLFLAVPLCAASAVCAAQQPAAPMDRKTDQTAAHPMDHMERRFDNPEELAKGFDDPKRDEWQMPDRVIAALRLRPGDIVADVGAGTGYFSVRLAKSAAHPNVIASDIEPAMIKYLQDRTRREGLNNVTPVLASATSPNLPEPVDVILIVDTYHHIGNRVVYFRELAKSLKPRGRIAIVDFKQDSPEGPPKEFRFPFEQFNREMTEAGYHLSARYDFLPRQQFMIFELGMKSGK